MKKMKVDVLDDFLDDATHMVAERWEKTGGKKMRLNDMYVLNEVLQEHFEEYLRNTEGK